MLIFSAFYAFGPGGEKRLERFFSYPDPLPEIEFETLALHERPNQFLICPRDLCAKTTAHDNAPIFKLNVRNLRNKFEAIALTQNNVELKRQSDHPPQSDYIVRTNIMRYPDIVTVRFIKLGPNSSTLAIYSRSVYGHSDFGVNEKRVKNWLKNLKEIPEIRN
jgi:uncharacterized protein (DUF1499 family)